MGSRGKTERPKTLQTNPTSQETSLTFPVDRENSIKMKNGADHCCATLLSDFRLKTGFSTASTCYPTIPNACLAICDFLLPPRYAQCGQLRKLNFC
jgi:hypothetical protein